MPLFNYFSKWFGAASTVTTIVFFTSPFIYMIGAVIMFGIVKTVLNDPYYYMPILSTLYASIPFGLIVGGFIAIVQKKFLPLPHNYVWHDWISKSAIASMIGACLFAPIAGYWIPPSTDPYVANTLDGLNVGRHAILGIVIGISFGQAWILRRIFRYSGLWVIAHLALAGVFFYTFYSDIYASYNYDFYPFDEVFIIQIYIPGLFAPGLLTGFAMLALIRLNHLQPLEEETFKKEKLPA